MSSRTPPLPALKAFAALVQCGTVAAAAETLSLTQGAVGHQIRALEAFVGQALVTRDGRRMQLTEAGRIYGYQVRQALDDIAEATERLSHRSERVSVQDGHVRLAVLPSLAQGWLLPRLGRFRRMHPGIRLTLEASMSLVDLGRGKAEAAIRFGHGHWPQLHATPLLADRLLLLAAPGQVASDASLDVILRGPLLHASESWSAWLASVGDDGLGLRPARPAMVFTDSTHLLEAARLGLGVALSRQCIADAALAQGELVQVHPHAALHTSRYYWVLANDTPENAARDVFAAWLFEECERYGVERGWVRRRG
jgi:LysR family transcriptional regulator, glycine cleavage system transcriptional activator